MNIVVIYDTKYGTSKKYASWIAKCLACDLFLCKESKKIDFNNYDIVICGGGLYAGKILGCTVFNKYDLKSKHRILFTVGLADPNVKENTDSIIKSVEKFVDDTNDLMVFHFRGGIDYKRLNWIHKPMMKMMYNMLKKKPTEALSVENKEFIDTYGKKTDFCDEKSIAPLVEYVHSLENNA